MQDGEKLSAVEPEDDHRKSYGSFVIGGRYIDGWNLDRFGLRTDFHLWPLDIKGW